MYLSSLYSTSAAPECTRVSAHVWLTPHFATPGLISRRPTGLLTPTVIGPGDEARAMRTFVPQRLYAAAPCASAGIFSHTRRACVASVVAWLSYNY